MDTPLTFLNSLEQLEVFFTTAIHFYYLSLICKGFFLFPHLLTYLLTYIKVFIFVISDNQLFSLQLPVLIYSEFLIHCLWS